MVALALGLAVSGCKKSEGGKDQLPPASGPGAAPLPAMPDLPGAAAGSGSAAAPPVGDAKTTGTLGPKTQVTVGARSSGTILKVMVKQGDKVKKGDVLFRLDSRDAQLMKKAALTGLRGAKLQVATAQREYDRAKGLAAQNAMPQMTLDQLQAALDGAKVGIAVAQNSVAMANKMIGDATVRAPLTGVVIAKLMSEGEYASMMPPTPVLVIQDQSKLELKFRLTERALRSMKEGDTVAVVIPALGIERSATISEIAPMVDVRTRTIEFTAVLDNADGALRPGLMAEVTLGGAPPAPPEKVAPVEKVVPAAAKKKPAPRKPAPKKAPPKTEATP